ERDDAPDQRLGSRQAVFRPADLIELGEGAGLSGRELEHLEAEPRGLGGVAGFVRLEGALDERPQMRARRRRGERAAIEPAAARRPQTAAARARDGIGNAHLTK